MVALGRMIEAEFSRHAILGPCRKHFHDVTMGGYWGATLMFIDTSLIPEPGALPLAVAGLATLALAHTLRRRARLGWTRRL